MIKLALVLVAATLLAAACGARASNGVIDILKANIRGKMGKAQVASGGAYGAYGAQDPASLYAAQQQYPAPGYNPYAHYPQQPAAHYGQTGHYGGYADASDPYNYGTATRHGYGAAMGHHNPYGSGLAGSSPLAPTHLDTFKHLHAHHDLDYDLDYDSRYRHGGHLAGYGRHGHHHGYNHHAPAGPGGAAAASAAAGANGAAASASAAGGKTQHLNHHHLPHQHHHFDGYLHTPPHVAGTHIHESVHGANGAATSATSAVGGGAAAAAAAAAGAEPRHYHETVHIPNGHIVSEHIEHDSGPQVHASAASAGTFTTDDHGVEKSSYQRSTEQVQKQERGHIDDDHYYQSQSYGKTYDDNLHEAFDKDDEDYEQTAYGFRKKKRKENYVKSHVKAQRESGSGVVAKNKHRTGFSKSSNKLVENVDQKTHREGAGIVQTENMVSSQNIDDGDEDFYDSDLPHGGHGAVKAAGAGAAAASASAGPGGVASSASAGSH